ncbi:MAG TPA: hypothetical protein VKR53_15895 [Puia sp.]|nr:hypothetical protein [Puia sp.]
MNNTFNARRFGFLFRKTLLERPVQIFGLTGLILTIILMIYFICKVFFGFGPAQNISFIWGLAGGGCFLGSFMFSYFNSNASGSSYLTLPASVFEKWLSAILIAGILYPLLFLLFFRAMDAGFVALYHRGLDATSPLYKIRYDQVYLFSYTGQIAQKVYLIFFMFTGAALTGSLYFNKNNFIKTALVFCVVCVLAFGLNWLMAVMVFGEVRDAAPFHYVEVTVGTGEGEINLPQSAFDIYGIFGDYFFPVLLWSIPFIRLREKEF